MSIQSYKQVPTIFRENTRNFVDTFIRLLSITIPTLVTCSGGEMDPAETGCCSVAVADNRGKLDIHPSQLLSREEPSRAESE